MMDAGATWTDERVELLKKLWTDGLSASQIAAELGNVTRNAVIGKVHRLGLSGRAQGRQACRLGRSDPRSQGHPRAQRSGSHPAAGAQQQRGDRPDPAAARDRACRRSSSRTTSRFPCRSA